MKQLIALLMSLSAITTTACAAPPFLNQSCCGSFFVGGEATFLYPCTTDLYFVLKGPLNPTNNFLPLGNLIAVKPDFTPGFNAWIGTCLCSGEYDLRFAWQYLHSQDARTITASGDNEVLFASSLFPGLEPNNRIFNAQARSWLRFDFDTADLEIGYFPCKCSRQMLRLIGGIRYAMVGHRNRIFYEGSENSPTANLSSAVVTEHSWVWGIGPRFAADFRYCICKGLGVRVLAGTGLLAGEIRSSQQSQQLINNGNVIDDVIGEKANTVCNLVPLVEAKLGIDYSLNCGCTIIRLSAGYQVARYFSAIQRQRFTNEFNASTYIMTSNAFDLIGFYVGAEVGF